MINDNIMKTDLMRYEESCLSFVEERIINRMLRVVKKGKEAVVVCCEAHPETGCDYIAIKLYRERKFRNFQRDDIYSEGRVWDKRLLRAIAKKTELGRQAERSVWTSTEYDALLKLYEAGVKVPEPFAATDDAVAMEFIGEDGYAAPLLKHVRFDDNRQARACFDEIVEATRTMALHHIIHGDLSAFNILYHKERPYIIDMPQSVDPSVNPNAWKLLLRDVEQIVEWFSRWGVNYDAEALAESIWEPVFGPVPRNVCMFAE